MTAYETRHPLTGESSWCMSRSDEKWNPKVPENVELSNS